MKNTLQRVVVSYPGGNATAIVFDDVIGANKKLLNESLVQAWKLQFPNMPEIEQCCYVTRPKNQSAIARVEMFGGEFCGNAARSVARILAKNDKAGLIEASGARVPLRFVRKDNEVTLYMPRLKVKNLVMFTPEGAIVYLEGIVQVVIIDDTDTPDLRSILGRLLKDGRYNLASEKCVGVSFYNPKTKKADFCIWVREVETIFDETACGSGTCAIGIVRAIITKAPVELLVRQPSGEVITAIVNYSDNEIKDVSISGSVKILYEGELTL